MSAIESPRRIPAGEHADVLAPEEFERLAETHRPGAMRYAFAFLQNRDHAEDAVQEALRRLYAHRDRYPLRRLFGPYLIKTIARLCVDVKRTRRSGDVGLQIGDERHVSREEPIHLAERKEVSKAMARAIQELPERERACLLMVVCEGLTYRDAAEALSLSFHEVNNAVHRARLALRKTLRPMIAGSVKA